MRRLLVVSALLFGPLFLAPAANAQEGEEKKAKKVKSQGTYKVDWGRRADITQRFAPIHQHPYTRIN